MKRTFVFLALLSLCLLTPLLCHAQTKARIAMSAPMGSPVARTIEGLADAIKEGSGDKLELVIFPPGSLGHGRQLIDMAKDGYIEMALLPIHAMRQIEPRFAVFDLVFLFDNLGVVNQFLEEDVFKEIVAATEEQTGLNPFRWDEEETECHYGHHT